MRSAARETAAQTALRDCSKEAGGWTICMWFWEGGVHAAKLIFLWKVSPGLMKLLLVMRNSHHHEGFQCFLDMRSYKNWAHKISSWEDLTTWRQTCPASFLGHRGPHFFCPRWTPSGVLELSSCGGSDLTLIEADGKPTAGKPTASAGAWLAPSMAESEEELKGLVMKVKVETEKVGLKLNIQKTQIMASGPITSWEIDGETVSDFIFLGSKITADGDFSHKIKTRLLLGRKVMTNLDSIFKSRDITLPTKVCLIKAMVFPVVMYGCESWTVKKAECRRIDAFELWCWRRLLRVLWTAGRSNQSILKEISPGFLWKEWC